MPTPARTAAAHFAKTIRSPREITAHLPALTAGRTSVAVAFSGGADSTAALLWAIGTFGPERTVAIHYHHGVRGEPADFDREHCRQMSEILGVRLITGNRPTSTSNDEASLRADRLDFLLKTCWEHAFAALIQGHHADDVAETMLMRIGRGSGAAGLAAPRPISRLPDAPAILRPLLETTKSQILSLLREHDIAWTHDETNDSAEFATRNRVRLQAVPAWKNALPADAPTGVLRTRRLLEEDDSALESWADTVIANLTIDNGPRIDWSRAGKIPRAVIRRVLHRLLIGFAPSTRLDAATFDRLVIALGEDDSLAISIAPGRRLEYKDKILAVRESTTPQPDLTPALLPAPGSIHWPDGAELRAEFAPPCRPDSPNVSYLNLPPPVVLECGPRRPGERYRPLGAPGSQKLQDTMINRRIPAELRDRIPVVRHAGETLWCPGLPPSENHRISEWEMPALRLTWTRADTA